MTRSSTPTIRLKRLFPTRGGVMKPKFLPLFALGPLLWLAPGCSGIEEQQELHTITSSEAIALINHNGQIARTLKTANATAQVKYGAQGLDTSVNAQVMHPRGGKLRLNIRLPVLGSQRELCSDGRTMWVHDKKNDKAYRERVSKLNRITRTAGLIRPEDITSALALEPVELGDPNTVVTLSEEVDWDGQTARAVYALSISERDHGDDFLLKQFLIDRTNLQMICQKVYERSGRMVMDVRYGRFLPVAFDRPGVSIASQEKTLILPHRILIDWPPFEMFFHMTMDAIQVNVPIPPEKFDYGQELDADYPYDEMPLNRGGL